MPIRKRKIFVTKSGLKIKNRKQKIKLPTDAVKLAVILNAFAQGENLTDFRKVPKWFQDTYPSFKKGIKFRRAPKLKVRDDRELQKQLAQQIALLSAQQTAQEKRDDKERIADITRLQELNTTMILDKNALQNQLNETLNATLAKIKNTKKKREERKFLDIEPIQQQIFDEESQDSVIKNLVDQAKGITLQQGQKMITNAKLIYFQALQGYLKTIYESLGQQPIKHNEITLSLLESFKQSVNEIKDPKKKERAVIALNNAIELVQKQGYSRNTTNEKVLGSSNIEIEKIMNNFLKLPQYAFFRDKYLGVFPKDDKQLDILIKKNKEQPFIFFIQNTNTFPNQQNLDQHWYATFIDNVHMCYNIFDSSGRHDERQIQDAKKKIQIIDPDYEYKFKLNSNDLQKNNSYCGLYSILFLLRMCQSFGDFNFSSLRELSHEQGKSIIDSVFGAI